MSNKQSGNKHENHYKGNSQNDQRHHVEGAPKHKSEEKKKKAPVVTINKEVLKESKKARQNPEKQSEASVIAATSTEKLSTETLTPDKTEAKKSEETASKGELPVPKEEPIAKSPEEIMNIAEKPEGIMPFNTPAYKETGSTEEAKPTDSTAQAEEKKDRRPSSIDLKDKSEGFKKIIDVALAYAKLEEDNKKLKSKTKAQGEEIQNLKDERDGLKGNLEATELLCRKKQADIDDLQAEIQHRNEVIDIVKADKKESSLEFINALAAALRPYMQDFKELKKLEMSDDVGFGVIETLEGVFKVLEKNGITV